MRKAVWVIVGAVLCAHPLAAQFSLAVNGGLGYSALGDFSKSARSSNDLIDKYGIWYSGKFETFHSGLSLGLEARYQIGPRIAVGLGVGTFRLSYDFDTDYDLEGRLAQNNNGWLRVIPVNLSGYYVLPLGARIRLNLGAGLGLYLISIQWNNAFDYGPGFNYEYSFDSSKTALGFHAGVEFEYELLARLSLIAALKGRYARASDFKGDWTLSAEWGGMSANESGSDWYFYYYEIIVGGDRYVNLAFADAPPTNAAESRKGIIDVSGFTAVIGLKYSFGRTSGR